MSRTRDAHGRFAAVSTVPAARRAQLIDLIHPGLFAEWQATRARGLAAGQSEDEADAFADHNHGAQLRAAGEIADRIIAAGL